MLGTKRLQLPKWSLLLLLSGCAFKTIPAHLQVQSSSSGEQVASPELPELETVDDVIRYALRGDPLARSARFPPVEDFATVPNTEALQEWVESLYTLAQSSREGVRMLQQLAASRPGTPLEALRRGNQLRLADQRLSASQSAPTSPALAPLPELLLHVEPAKRPEELGTNPISFLEGPRGFIEAVRTYGDRWVLESWLQGPDIPLAAVSEALDQANFDKLSSHGVGLLIQSRAAGAEAPTDEAQAALVQATLLALEQVAADTNREQKAFRAKEEALVESGLTNPIVDLLQTASAGFIANASDDYSAGAALLSINALRLLGECEDAPCNGLDRTETLGWARSWHPALARWVDLWQVIALKRGMDSFEVGQSTVLYRESMVDLSDAILGTGGLAVPSDFLSMNTADPVVYNQMGIMLGGDPASDWDSLKLLLNAHLTKVTQKALKSAPSEATPTLNRLKMRLSP